MTSLVNAAIAGIGNTSPRTAFPTSNRIAAARDVSFKDNLQNWEVAGSNLDWLQSDVIEILKAKGTDCNVFLPGVGILDGLTAGNYLDSAGTTAATVDNPVGLVLDANGSVGSEIKSTGTLAQRGVSTASTYDTTTGVGSVSRVNSTNQSSIVFACNANSTYRITVTNSTANLLNIRDGSDIGTLLQQVPANTTATYHLKFSLTSIAIAAASDGVTVNFTISSIKEVTGIHALQGTTANKPILRYASGRYYFDFVDGTDVLNATYPAGWESVTTIDAAPTGQATLTAQNIVGTYAITTDTYGRFVFKTITASELAIIQSYCNRLAGV